MRPAFVEGRRQLGTQTPPSSQEHAPKTSQAARHLRPSQFPLADFGAAAIPQPTGPASQPLMLQRCARPSQVSSTCSCEAGDERKRSVRSRVLDVVARGGGQPLEPRTRQVMQGALGADLSEVRIHDNGAASAAAQEVEALAYTMGKDVVFRSGTYQPDTPAGQRLLAHELTHVIQQNRRPVDGAATGDGIVVSDPSDSFERAADEVADRVVSSGVIESYISAAQRRGDESASPASPNSQDPTARAKQTPVRSGVVDSTMSQGSAIFHPPRATRNHVVSRLLARQRAPSGAAPAAPVPAAAPGVEAIVEQDIRANKALFLVGLDQAAIRFGRDVPAQLEAEKVEDREGLWVNFGMALVSLAMPLLCPIVGLNPVGIGLILGTFKLTMDPALQDPKKATEAALEKAITDYVIAPTGSIAAGIDSVNSKTAASTLVGRHKEPTSDQARIAVAQELFQPDVLDGYEVKAEKVNDHVHGEMMRMWNLQTVGARAGEAFGAECVMGVCGPDAVTAFVNKTAEVFPDFLDKMSEHMPERYDYWKKRKWRLNSFDISPFKQDINILAQIVSSKEFGTKPPRYSEQPEIWRAD